MSLRAARSLPCLRNALQQSLRESTTPAIPKMNVQNFSTSNFTNSQGTKASLKNRITTRNVHQTTQKKSTLLSSNNNKYGSMNLQALKTECRTRGIKVSGKKADLIQRLATSDESRIMQHEGSRNITTKSDQKATTEAFKEFQKNINRKLSTKKVETPAPFKSAAKVAKKFSTSAKAEAKGDTSPVDSAKFPDADYVIPKPKTAAPSLLPKDPVKHIDVVETKTKIADMEGAVSVGGDNTGEVAVPENIFKKFLIDEAAESEPSQPKFEPSKEEISSKDKLILGGIFGTVVAWWALKPKSQKK